MKIKLCDTEEKKLKKVNKKILKEIRRYFETNENGNTTLQNL